MTGIRLGPIIVGALIGNIGAVLIVMAIRGTWPWWTLAIYAAAYWALSAWYTSESHAWRSARRAYQRRTKEHT